MTERDIYDLNVPQTHCTARLTEGEALDAANIVRRYAKQIRAGMPPDRMPYNKELRAALEDAAKKRDRLADKLESMS